MLLIREVARLVWDLIRFSIATRQVLLLVAVVIVAVVSAVTASVTVLGPVAVYPFL